MSADLRFPSKTIRRGVIIRSPWAEAGSTFSIPAVAAIKIIADLNLWHNPGPLKIDILSLLIGLSF
jgi:hypothetical protein